MDPYTLLGLELFNKTWSDAPFIREEYTLIAKALEEERILEVGVGVGAIARRLVQDGKEVVGVDSHAGCVEFTRQKINSPRYSAQIADASNLGFTNEFDGVVCTSTMPYLNEPNKFTQSAYKALKPRGLLVVTGYENWPEHTRRGLEYARRAIESGEIKLNDEEKERFRQVKAPDTYPVDSTQRSIDAIVDSGFEVIDRGLFYHDSAYFIVARKKD